MTRALRFLHLSDLQLGGPGQARWWQVEADFQRSLAAMMERVGGAPDILLLSGDLTDAGAPAQFELVDAFIRKLDVVFGVTPFVVPVPGNHDVMRPETRHARHFAFLDDLASGRDDPTIADLYQQLWDERDTSEISPLFTTYAAWLDRRLEAQARAGITVHRSHFPGDLAVSVALPGVTPAFIVGLNSAWQQYRDGKYHGRLELPLEQFHAALGGPNDDPLAPLAGPGRHNLLMMHHAPSWLSEQARATFDSAIFPPDRFAGAFFGHLHGPRSEISAQAGGRARHVFQAASLCGREQDRDGQSRPLGYAWGALAAGGELRLWPLRHERKGDGVNTFDPDPFFHCDEGQGGFVLHEGRHPRAITTPARLRADALGLGLYLDRLERDTSHIELDGLARADEAARYPIEDMYVRLVLK